MVWMVLLWGCAAPTHEFVHCSSRGAVLDTPERGLIRVSDACTENLEGWELEGRVVAIEGSVISVHHKAISGFMDEMTMDLHLPEGEPASLMPGDRIEARLLQAAGRFWLVDITVVGSSPVELRGDVPAIRVGQKWPDFEAVDASGTPFQLRGPAVLAFLYTTCPNPEFCPALVSRLLALQEQVPEGARIVTVTLDPKRDTPEVLAAYGTRVGVDPSRWDLVHTDLETVERLALEAGQQVTREPGGIRHAHRLVVLDADGIVIERYDHNRWPLQRVTSQLETGRPIGLHP